MRERKKKMSMRKRKALVGYTFIAPWILGAAVFFVFPMIYSLILSFSKPNNISDFDITPVGLENYKEALFTDVKFFGYFVDSVKDAIINPILILAFSMLLAFLVNQKINFKGLFRTTFFLPVVLGSGFIMQQLLGENLQQQTVSVVSEILLSEELTRALPYTVVSFIQELLQRITIILWSSGVQIVLFLGGLQSIPNTIYEAADIDAAGEWEKFWLITFPLLMPTTLLCAIYTIVDSFANSANEALNYIMDVAFDKNSFEVSAAMGWLYFGFVALLILIVYLFINKVSEKSNG